MSTVRQGAGRPLACEVGCVGAERYLPWVRRFVPAVARAAGLALPRAIAWRCTVALVEAVNNAVEHAHRHDRERPVWIRCCCDAQAVRLTVRDAGGPLLPPRGVLPRPGDRRGRGVYLMRTLMHAVRYRQRPDGNEVELVYYGPFRPL